MSEGGKQLRYPREVVSRLCSRKNHVNLLNLFCGQLFLDVLAVVNHEISAHLMAPLAGFRARCRADDQGTCLRFQHLRSDGAYSARASDDQHPFDPDWQIVLLPKHGLPSSERANRKGGSVNEREAFGNSGKNSVIHRHTFGPGTISRHISGSENPVASLEPANTGACLDNHTCKFPTKQDTPARFCAACPADEGFAWVNPDCMNFNEHIQFTKGRLWNLRQLDSEVFEVVRSLVYECFHSENLSRNVSLMPASGPPSC